MPARRLIVLIEKFGGDDYNFYTIYVSLLLAVIRGGHRACFSAENRAKAGYILLLIAVVAEMVFNAGWSFATIQAKEYFTARSDYVANDITKAIDKAAKRTEEIGDRKAAAKFYRIELLPAAPPWIPRCLTTAGLPRLPPAAAEAREVHGLYRIRGERGQQFITKLCSVYRFPAGIKYVMLDYSTRTACRQTYLEFIEKVDYNGTTYSIYRNKTALPLGYTVGLQSRTGYRPNTTRLLR